MLNMFGIYWQHVDSQYARNRLLNASAYISISRCIDISFYLVLNVSAAYEGVGFFTYRTPQL